jgi:hypothetical protein
MTQSTDLCNFDLPMRKMTMLKIFYIFRDFGHFLLGDFLYEWLTLLVRMKYFPNIKNPRSFNEKLVHRKLFAPPKDSHIIADKSAVREIVKDKVGDEILNKVYFLGDDSEKIPFDYLPDQFIVKFTHNSGNNIVVKDKSSINVDKIKRLCTTELSRKFGWEACEKWYLDIPPQIIIEELLIDSEHDIPLDYKFFMFHGQCAFIQVIAGRFGKKTSRCLMSPDWELLNVRYKYPIGSPPEKPQKLNQMIEIASTLSQDFDFIRVDLYLVNQKDIRFGELTLAPFAGHGPFTPTSKDFEFGALWSQKN